MFDDINDIRRTRKRINAEMFRSGVDTFRAFEDVVAVRVGHDRVPGAPERVKRRLPAPGSPPMSAPRRGHRQPAGSAT